MGICARFAISGGRRVCKAVVIGLGVSLVLSSCASMSEKECLTVSWTDQGYRDGRQGYPMARVEDHREACVKVGVIPDITQYRAGHDRGVLEYCTPDNAVSEGRLGRPYRQACPVSLEGQFLAYHERGMRVYRAQQQIDRLHRQSQQQQRVLDKEKNEVKRRHLRTELREIDRRLREARDALHYEEMRLSD